MSDLNVSRETSERLEQFVALVRKWNPRINLIAKSTVDEIWERHIRDSLQVFDVAPRGDRWVDIGSGGGFPGVVAAIAAKGAAPDLRFTLIESDQRKCAFLRTASRELGLNIEVLAQRIEAAPPQSADILSARALASLSDLLEHAERHLAADGTALFQKGANWEKEVEEARQAWTFRYDAIKSQTNEAAVILKIEGVSRD